MPDPVSTRRALPETLLGLVALAVAIAIVVPVTASIVVSGIRDIKQSRVTIQATGSAHYPISANLATWDVSVSAQERTPEAAIRTLRAKSKRVEAFLAAGGLPPSAISRPPISVEPTSFNVPTGLKKPAFRSIPAWRVAQDFSIQSVVSVTFRLR